MWSGVQGGMMLEKGEKVGEREGSGEGIKEKGRRRG